MRRAGRAGRAGLGGGGGRETGAAVAVGGSGILNRLLAVQVIEEFVHTVAAIDGIRIASLAATDIHIVAGERCEFAAEVLSEAPLWLAPIGGVIRQVVDETIAAIVDAVADFGHRIAGLRADILPV